ncbi:MAG: endopeptidase La [Chloroflexi bacterium]|nr:endopeptidase La [Chloroflexota bacterium]
MTVDDFASVNLAPDGENPDKGDLPFDVPILPLKDTVVYPLTVVPLAVGQERSLKLVDDVAARDRLIGLVAQRNAETQLAGPDEVFQVGTLGKIHQLLKMPDGTIRLVMQGLQRVRVLEYSQEQPYLIARVQPMPETEEEGLEVDAMARNVVSLFQQLVNLSPYLPDELVAAAMNVESSRQLAYFVAMNLRLELEQRQRFLETDSISEKLKVLTGYLNKELEVLELGRKIQSEAQEQMTKAQRDYYLREQLRAIQKQLGEESPEEAEIRDLREKVENSGMPEEARKEAERELSRLEKIPSASPEHGVIRNYLDWLTALPWDVSTGKTIDVAEARRILDEDHYDLEKVKDRILEYLAVRKLKEERQEGEADPSAMKEPILCFVGPPGVGKTSLGQSIARAMGRKFIRQSLGGVRDEAEVRGHRRTYIGAMPGRILQAIRRAESNDPVFMMDEVDKIGADWRGDPSSALLEVLDPEQNKDFRDHYVDVPFDLSKVMFITTANTLETIPAPLRDRMEILQLAGYTEEEKVQIAKRYIVLKQMKAHGLKPEEVAVEDDALHTIVRDYTREAGVRNLEREVATVYRKAAREIAEGVAATVQVTPEKVREYLGRPRHFAEVAERVDRPGVVTGLVWTPVGGEIVFIEAASMPGAKVLKLTGQLGDVMRESAEAAYSCIRSRLAKLGAPENYFEKHDIHIHVPAGAVPKDGPSAGVTMATALASIVTGRPVRHDVAMTGEITLLGKVLPIGGLKEKVLGAHRAGITTIILPRRNEGDLEDLPAELREQMEFVPVETIDEVLAKALLPAREGENSKEHAPFGEPTPA